MIKKQIIKIYGELETIDMRLKPYYQLDDDVLRLKKIYIKELSEAEKKIQTYVEKALDCVFDSSCVEAESHQFSSMIYRYKTRSFEYTLFIRVECEGKKVEFPHYFSADKYA